ncbi:LigB domain-containing protein [Sulfidibacter corallicola]|uniref:Extradiol ring-cleavage dioxygenase class III enzyme subunit B domain-containing protein n=1 Tax=Sulfidibacter corallicola TaxID=2818388 RepID=A0A8A4TGM3_SULCO|nr:class III extradiol dioxygenase subunit B-like domain-containing protein [Sulfidibacter corallicola]QTD48700.1 hypothetical protein J3U87_24225 [Sulfidibacter corallicola]
MAIVWCGLAPHPPVIVDAVGKWRCEEVAPTIDSMRRWSADCLAATPDRIVVISPHTPRPHNGISSWFGSQIDGDFSRFSAAGCRVRLHNDVTWMKAFRGHYHDITDLEMEPLDHGALVPLHFLVEAGWNGPTAVISLPWSANGELDRIGKAIAAACTDDRRTALVASGDMSHCLKPDAPCGYSKHGQEFDDAFVAAIKDADYRKARDIHVNLQIEAKQDVLESCMIAWAATGYDANNHHFYSYEGPFGVGYSVMRFSGPATVERMT